MFKPTLTAEAPIRRGLGGWCGSACMGAHTFKFLDLHKYDINRILPKLTTKIGRCTELCTLVLGYGVQNAGS